MREAWKRCLRSIAEISAMRDSSGNWRAFCYKSPYELVASMLFEYACPLFGVPLSCTLYFVSFSFYLFIAYSCCTSFKQRYSKSRTWREVTSVDVVCNCICILSHAHSYVYLFHALHTYLRVTPLLWHHLIGRYKLTRVKGPMTETWLPANSHCERLLRTTEYAVYCLFAVPERTLPEVAARSFDHLVTVALNVSKWPHSLTNSVFGHHFTKCCLGGIFFPFLS